MIVLVSFIVLLQGIPDFSHGASHPYIPIHSFCSGGVGRLLKKKKKKKKNKKKKKKKKMKKNRRFPDFQT